jgi:hypothetical protein
MSTCSTGKHKIAQPQPIRDNLGASIIGPKKPSRKAANPDVIVSPSSGHGTVGNMRWSLADSHTS